MNAPKSKSQQQPLEDRSERGRGVFDQLRAASDAETVGRWVRSLGLSERQGWEVFERLSVARGEAYAQRAFGMDRWEDLGTLLAGIRGERGGATVAELGVSGSGVALPHAEMAEGRAGVDARGVKAHVDPLARAAARALDAHAFAFGEGIAFADPNPPVEVVAHELAHVGQQRASGPRVQRKGKGAQDAGADEAKARDAESAPVMKAAHKRDLKAEIGSFQPHAGPFRHWKFSVSVAVSAKKKSAGKGALVEGTFKSGTKGKSGGRLESKGAVEIKVGTLSVGKIAKAIFADRKKAAAKQGPDAYRGIPGWVTVDAGVDVKIAFEEKRAGGLTAGPREAKLLPVSVWVKAKRKAEGPGKPELEAKIEVKAEATSSDVERWWKERRLKKAEKALDDVGRHEARRARLEAEVAHLEEADPKAKRLKIARLELEKTKRIDRFRALSAADQHGVLQVLAHHGRTEAPWHSKVAKAYLESVGGQDRAELRKTLLPFADPERARHTAYRQAVKPHLEYERSKDAFLRQRAEAQRRMDVADTRLKAFDAHVRQREAALEPRRRPPKKSKLGRFMALPFEDRARILLHMNAGQDLSELAEGPRTSAPAKRWIRALDGEAPSALMRTHMTASVQRDHYRVLPRLFTELPADAKKEVLKRMEFMNELRRTSDLSPKAALVLRVYSLWDDRELPKALGSIAEKGRESAHRKAAQDKLARLQRPEEPKPTARSTTDTKRQIAAAEKALLEVEVERDRALKALGGKLPAEDAAAIRKELEGLGKALSAKELSQADRAVKGADSRAVREVARALGSRAKVAADAELAMSRGAKVKLAKDAAKASSEGPSALRVPGRGKVARSLGALSPEALRYAELKAALPLVQRAHSLSAQAKTLAGAVAVARAARVKELKAELGREKGVDKPAVRAELDEIKRAIQAEYRIERGKVLDDLAKTERKLNDALAGIKKNKALTSGERVQATLDALGDRHKARMGHLDKLSGLDKAASEQGLSKGAKHWAVDVAHDALGAREKTKLMSAEEFKALKAQLESAMLEAFSKSQDNLSTVFKTGDDQAQAAARQALRKYATELGLDAAQTKRFMNQAEAALSTSFQRSLKTQDKAHALAKVLLAAKFGDEAAAVASSGIVKRGLAWAGAKGCKALPFAGWAADAAAVTVDLYRIHQLYEAGQLWTVKGAFEIAHLVTDLVGFIPGVGDIVAVAGDIVHALRDVIAVVAEDPDQALADLKAHLESALKDSFMERVKKAEVDKKNAGGQAAALSKERQAGKAKTGGGDQWDRDADPKTKRHGNARRKGVPDAKDAKKKRPEVLDAPVDPKLDPKKDAGRERSTTKAGKRGTTATNLESDAKVKELPGTAFVMSKGEVVISADGKRATVKMGAKRYDEAPVLLARRARIHLRHKGKTLTFEKSEVRRAGDSVTLVFEAWKPKKKGGTKGGVEAGRAKAPDKGGQGAGKRPRVASGLNDVLAKALEWRGSGLKLDEQGAPIFHPDKVVGMRVSHMDGPVKVEKVELKKTGSRGKGSDRADIYAVTVHWTIETTRGEVERGQRYHVEKEFVVNPRSGAALALRRGSLAKLRGLVGPKGRLKRGVVGSVCAIDVGKVVVVSVAPSRKKGLALVQMKLPKGAAPIFFVDDRGRSVWLEPGETQRVWVRYGKS